MVVVGVVGFVEEEDLGFERDLRWVVSFSSRSLMSLGSRYYDYDISIIIIIIDRYKDLSYLTNLDVEVEIDSVEGAECFMVRGWMNEMRWNGMDRWLISIMR